MLISSLYSEQNSEGEPTARKSLSPNTKKPSLFFYNSLRLNVMEVIDDEDAHEHQREIEESDSEEGDYKSEEDQSMEDAE